VSATFCVMFASNIQNELKKIVMKTGMKLLSVTLLLVGLLTGCTVLGDSIKPSKNYITRKYKVKEFNKIDVSTVGDVFFSQSTDGTTSVQIYGPDNIIALMQVEVKDNTLILNTEKHNKIRNLKKMKITISSPALIGLYFKGVGDISIEDSLVTSDLEIESKGVGNVKVHSVQCEELKVSSMGVGNVELQGLAKEAFFASKGVGDIEAVNLKAQSVEASSQGVGNISCYATESLSASVKGVGSINYKGMPKEKNFNKGGIGTIKAF